MRARNSERIIQEKERERGRDGQGRSNEWMDSARIPVWVTRTGRRVRDTDSDRTERWKENEKHRSLCKGSARYSSNATSNVLLNGPAIRLPDEHVRFDVLLANTPRDGCRPKDVRDRRSMAVFFFGTPEVPGGAVRTSKAAKVFRKLTRALAGFGS